MNKSYTSVLTFFLFIFLTFFNISHSLSYDRSETQHEDESAITTVENDKKSLLDMLFGAFTKKQDEDNNLDNSTHLEDALKSTPDDINSNSVVKSRENLEGDFFNTSNFTIINIRTGGVQKASIKVGEIYEFENIAIKNISCWEKFERKILPEARSLIELYKKSDKGNISKTFNGWLLSSSQNSSLLENKEYDIVLNSCLNNN